jgi:hypothetical protein
MDEDRNRLAYDSEEFDQLEVVDPGDPDAPLGPDTDKLPET